MIIACVACSTRYVVPDAKIVGRKVRTVCKRCGAGLMVDGTHEPPKIVAENAEALQRSREEYLVAFSANHKERLTVKRIVELYAVGAITTSTHAWREGMDKWLTLFEIDPIATELRVAGYLPVIGTRVRDEDEEEDDNKGYDSATQVARPPPVQVPDDEDMTRVARRPPAENHVPPRAAAKPLSVKAPDEEDQTQVFRADQVKDKQAPDAVEQALSMGEGNADSVTKVASASNHVPPALPPEVPQSRPPSVPPPRRISLPPVAVPVAEMLLEPTSTLSMSHTVLSKQRRRNPVLVAFVVLTLAAALVLVVLYVTGKWPLVRKATAEVHDKLTLVAAR